jgi:Tol biopolymer transport system component
MKPAMALVSVLMCVVALAAIGRPHATADVVAPAQSQQGEPSIIFSSNRTGSWSIWAVKPDGSGLHQLSKPSAGEQDVDPAFSPDTSKVLFTSTRGGKTGLWQMGRDGGDATRVCDGDQGAWAPDGKKIVFRRGGKLLTRDLASGDEKAITPHDFEKCSGPAWSPDGSTIAFALLGDGSNAIYLVPADGGTPTKVYDKQGACQPHWSPNGKTLVYETETHLCSINPDGTKNRPITDFGGVQRYARFSPDGTRLVFCQAPDPEGPWELYVIPAAGGTPVKLTDGGSDMYPDWK